MAQDTAWAVRLRAKGAIEVDALAVCQALLLGKVLLVVHDGGRVYVKAKLVACKGGIDHCAHVFHNLHKRALAAQLIRLEVCASCLLLMCESAMCYLAICNTSR